MAVAKNKNVPAPWLETLRLSMRNFTLDDFDDLYALNSDPRVMKYIADGTVSTRDEVAGALRRFVRYSTLYPDLGIWHTSRRDTGAFIGFFALNYTGKSTDIEIGYRLLRNAWGLGFATEGATALAHYGFDDLCLDRIIGVTLPGNKASQSVLMKAGLVDQGWGRYYNRRLRLFAAEREGS
ncbi:MAG: GNAT family N-acetyltransferase [Betaproteobacteria bacterium]